MQRYRYAHDEPVAYLITFRTYGSWLHGDVRGSVDRLHNVYGSDFLEPDGERSQAEARLQKAPSSRLSLPQQACVRAAVEQTCIHRGLECHALHVGATHVHVVVGAEGSPEPIMNSLKSWSTRRLREAGLISVTQCMWSRHGSTGYLWDLDDLAAACTYVLERQHER